MILCPKCIYLAGEHLDGCLYSKHVPLTGEHCEVDFISLHIPVVGKCFWLRHQYQKKI